MMTDANNTASEKIMTALVDAGPVRMGFRYAVTDLGYGYRVRSLTLPEAYLGHFGRGVFEAS